MELGEWEANVVEIKNPEYFIREKIVVFEDRKDSEAADQADGEQQPPHVLTALPVEKDSREIIESGYEKNEAEIFYVPAAIEKIRTRQKENVSCSLLVGNGPEHPKDGQQENSVRQAVKKHG